MFVDIRRILLFLLVILLLAPAGPARAAFERACDNFIFLVDASGSMDQSYKDRRQLDIVKRVLADINSRIAEAPYTAALRVFGQDFTYAEPFQSALHYPPAAYDRPAMAAAFAKITNHLSWSWSSLGYGLDMVRQDLKSMTGRVHIIILSDGDENSNYALPIDVARQLTAEYPDRLCIYAIQIAPTTRGMEILEAVVDSSDCGRLFRADDLQDEARLAQFMAEVFGGETAVPDHDGDGVADFLDKCPGTAAGVRVDDRGCPPDSDGDGVADGQDNCLGTPKGAVVDEQGCWHPAVIYFDFDQDEIRPDFFAALDEIAALLLQNPELQLTVQGHTDFLGAEVYNDGLSLRRAAAVKKYLTGRNVPARQLATEGLGETQPAVREPSRQGRALNRRVIFMRK